MKQLQSTDPIARDYAISILASWNGDLGYTPAVAKLLSLHGYAMIDLLEVVEARNPAAVIKGGPA